MVYLEYQIMMMHQLLVALGLHALQHRGQEGCGIVSFDGKNYHSEKRQGLVGDHFTEFQKH